MAGVDIVIGTPSHVQDLHRNGTLSLRDLRHVVFDGFDHETNDPTFADFIYQNQTGQRHIQTIIVFCQSESPSWVDHLETKYLRTEWKGNGIYNTWPEDNDYTNYALECPFSNRDAMVASLLRLHGDQAMIFGEREDVDQLALNGIIDQQVAVLHSDTPHDRKEMIFEDFKEGRLKFLASSDISPHSADYPSTKLILHLGPGKDSNNYLHRNRPTDRDGCSTIIYDPSELDAVKSHMQDFVVSYELGSFELWKISTEKQPEILHSMVEITMRSLSAISESVEKRFVETARGLLERRTSVSVISSALAVVAGRVKGKH